MELWQASRDWKDAVVKKDIWGIVNLAEEPSTKRALLESLSDPSDPLASYFFGDSDSVKSFFAQHNNLTQRFLRVGNSNTFYACYYDPERFNGNWSLDLMRKYSVDLDSVVCESFYERGGKWYLDFDMPIFDGD